MAGMPSVRRVSANTPQRDNDRIKAQTARRVRYYAEHPERIDERLRQLDREWDIERRLQASTSALGLIGMALAALRNRRFLLLPLAALACQLQYALQGWCPPLRLFRRRGVRTRFEIDCERYALKILRGDFDQVHRQGGVEQALRAVDFELPEPPPRPQATQH